MLRTSRDPDSKSQFVDSVLADRIEIDSWLTTIDNFQFIQEKRQGTKSKNKSIAAVHQTLYPDWWVKEKIDPKEAADVDVFRDLGPMGRQMVKPR
jgi:hypothetical protein